MGGVAVEDVSRKQTSLKQMRSLKGENTETGAKTWNGTFRNVHQESRYL